MNRLNSILVLLVALVAVFLEASFDGVRKLLGAQVDLLPALIVYTSLSQGLPTLIGLAVMGGLCFDSLSENPLGISVLPLLLPGFLIYTRRGLILRDQFYAQLTLGLVASAAAPILSLVMMSCTHHAPLLGWHSIWQLVVMTAGGGLMTPVCFRLFDGLSHAFNYRPAVETSFRPDREIRRGRN